MHTRSWFAGRGGVETSMEHRFDTTALTVLYAGKSTSCTNRAAVYTHPLSWGNVRTMGSGTLSTIEIAPLW